MEKRETSKSLVLALMMSTSFFNSFMAAALNISLPQIAGEFSLTASNISWLAMSFLLSSAMFLVPVGKLSDIVGRRKVFLLGNIIFAITSMLSPFSGNFATLLTLRFIQGIGSAMIFGTGMAIVASVFPPNERGKAIGINVSAVYLGLTLAPAIGGYMTQLFGWRSIFVLNAGASIIIIATIFVKMKQEWADARHEAFDVTGTIIYMSAIFTLMFGFSQLPKPFAIVLTLAGLTLFYAFVRWELKVKNPVLSMHLFATNRVFLMSNIAALINYAATFAITFILSLYLQYVKGFSPRDAGLILVTQPLFMATVASFAGKLSDRYESRTLSSIGMLIIIIGLASLAFIDKNTSIFVIMVSLFIVGVGFGFFSSPNTNAIMGSVEKRFLGVASAMTGTMRIIGQMFSMAIATMCIHMMLGNAKICHKNAPQFISSSRMIFVIFCILCAFGILASLTRGKVGKHHAGH